MPLYLHLVSPDSYIFLPARRSATKPSNVKRTTVVTVNVNEQTAQLNVVVMPKHSNKRVDHVVSVTLHGSGTLLGSGAGTSLPVTPYYSNSVTSCIEWGSYAARFQEFRVKAVHIRAIPKFPQAYSGVAHSVVAWAHQENNTSAITAASILAADGVRVGSTTKAIVLTTTWSENNNAKLWTAIATTLPAANVFGMVIGSPSTASAITTGSTFYNVIDSYDVEFRAPM